MTDLVVELGSQTGGGVARELSLAIGDPTLEVGYWLPDEGRYADAAGRTIVPIGPADRRSTTLIGREGGPVAILVHGPDVGADPGVRAALARAAELSAANARLNAGVLAQVAEVAASRRRLLDAAELERLDLQARLRNEMHPQLTAIASILEDGALRSPVLAPMVQNVRGQLEAAAGELTALAEGLLPAVLIERGLRAALDELIERSPMPVALEMDPDASLPAALQATAYFVCSEALANVAKHAGASRVRIRVVRQPGTLRVEIEDDGRGGASLGRGTGLSGLRDRIETVGGTFVIDSPSGKGTRLLAVLPAHDDTVSR